MKCYSESCFTVDDEIVYIEFMYHYCLQTLLKEMPREHDPNDMKYLLKSFILLYPDTRANFQNLSALLGNPINRI